MSILEMLFHIAWTNLDVPFAPSLSHCLNDVPILSCFLQWANLLDLTFWMSCGDKYIYMFGAWNHDGGSWQCMYPYLTHGTEHTSTLCKFLSCANNIEHKSWPAELFWNLRCLVRNKLKSHKLWCFFNGLVQKPNSIIFRLFTQLVSVSSQNAQNTITSFNLPRIPCYCSCLAPPFCNTSFFFIMMLF
jgi:hypothetical protein